MKQSKSVNSLSATSQQQQQQQQMMNGHTSGRPQPEPRANQQTIASGSSAPTSPICRCRVVYLGSSVPHETKDGLQGIQQPLRELYPDRAALSQGNAGIDSWLSVWSNGILIENVDETGREVKKFFKIEALHYCAAVKFVPQANHLMNSNITANGTTATLPHNSTSALPKFLPLDSPHARLQQDTNTSPPIFASILRRTTGVKVLECHAFICKREAAANALVRCCFHAYADTMYAKQIGAEIENLTPAVNDRQTANQTGNGYSSNGRLPTNGAPAIAARRSKSIAALNDVPSDSATASGGDYGDSNYHHHQQQQHRQDFQGAVLRRRSLNNGQQQLNYSNSGGDMSDGSQQQQGYESANNLRSQKYNSKSMHHLNQAHLDQSFNNFLHQDGGHLNGNNQSTSYHNLVNKNKFENSCEPSPLFPHNPYAARVPSYPPQNIIDQQQQQQQQQQQMQMQAINGGTLRSVKSVAANSIASTLLRSKKHAKAMSMAQLNSQQQQQLFNQQQQHQQQPITSFHQHPLQAPDGSLYGGSFMTLPPVPPMFLPNVPRHINGSQTMNLPSRHQLLPQMGPPMPINFEAMTPKEMKKLLKKSAKYGLDPSKFADNGLPLMPLRPIAMPMSPQMHHAAMFGQPADGTINSMAGMPSGPRHDMPDMANPFGPPPPMFLPPPPPLPEHLLDPNVGGGPPIKSILVKPNPEFLKSKAGKKWLKQQKEFKKLLPSHLDGLPIVFGPPPMDMLDPADGQSVGPNSSSSSTISSKKIIAQQRASFVHPPSHMPPPPPSAAGASASTGQLPMLDTNGFYSPHPLYGPSGRASAASTLLRRSPQVTQQQLQEDHRHMIMMQQQQQQQHINHHQSMYSNPILMSGGHHLQQQHHAPPPPPPPPMLPPHLQQPCDDLYGTGPTYNPRQFVPSNASSSSRRRRNHMVEQSVISLGDEENDDEDDEDQDGPAANGGLYGDEHDAEGQSTDTNGYYSQVESQAQESSRQRHRRRRKSSSGEQQQQTHHLKSEHIAGPDYDQDDYEQISNHHNQLQQQQLANEDHNGNSSGIYRRRGHINERAFSYSIRQEASKSSADNSDAEYRNGELSDSNYQRNNNNYLKYRLGQQQPIQQQQRQDMAQYDNPQASNHQDRPPIHYYKQHHQQQPVDDLSARLENQLNMKSFANSGVKSHM